MRIQEIPAVPEKQNTGKQNTGRPRPVYARKLPPGRTLTGAAPGAYRADGTFVPWDCLGTEVNGTELSDISETSDLSGSVLVIPEGIVSLARSVLYCSRAAGVVLPDSVRRIGFHAFSCCAAEYVRFPACLRSVGESAFSSSGIRCAVLPEGLKTAGKRAFSHSSVSAAVIPDAVCGAGLFGHSEALTAVRMRCPEDASVFTGCTGLKSAHLSSCTVLPEFTFSGCQRLETADLCGRLSEVRTYAFRDCVSLRYASLPSGCTLPEDGTAFDGCIGLVSETAGGKELLYRASYQPQFLCV